MNESNTDGAIGAVSRVIGRFTADEPGPTLICVGAMHGNEPAGYRGLRRVVDALGESPHLERGEFFALAGNLAAMDQRVRFVDRDLNRDWLPTYFLSEHGPKGSGVEDQQQVELILELQGAIERATGQIFLLDLHTTSGESRPFSIIADSLKTRKFAKAFPTPIMLGLEEHLGGTLVDCVTNLGFAAVAFEAGQNDGIDSVVNVEAAVWTALQFTGILGKGLTKKFSFAHSQLKEMAHNLPHLAEVRYRHDVSEAEDFSITAGLEGFDQVNAGQVVAHDSNGDVTTPEGGYLLMPKYQVQGNDGFFIVRPVKPFWLSVSGFLRRIQLYRIVHLLPGVNRDPENPLGVIVRITVARWFALEFLHLLGFKRIRATGNTLWMSRRQSLLDPTNRGT